MRLAGGFLLGLAMLAAACGSSGSKPAATEATGAGETTEGIEAPTEESAPSGTEVERGAVGELADSFVAVGDVEVRVQRMDVDEAAVTVLFLHGAAYTSDTWVGNGILEAIAVGRVSGVAVDLPGFGQTMRTELGEGEFLGALFDAIGLDPARTVMISPSMSGSFALTALDEGRLGDLAGFVGVAPSGSSRFGDRSDPLDVPALAVWGDGDGGDPQGSAAQLARGFVDGRVLVIENAGHAAYQQQPEAFTAALMEFVDGLGLCETPSCFG